MYNSFVSMWTNDVSLAEKDRDRFSSEKRELEVKLQAARDSSAEMVQQQNDVPDLRTEEARILQDLDHLTKPDGAMQQQLEELKKWEVRVTQVKDQIKQDLDGKGAINAQHLFNINNVMLNHANTSNEVAIRHGTGKQGWQQHLVLAIKLVKSIKTAPTKELMVYKLAALWQYLNKTEPKFRYFMEHCNMITDLETSGFGNVPPSLTSASFDPAPDPFTGMPACPALLATPAAATVPSASTSLPATSTAVASVASASLGASVTSSIAPVSTALVPAISAAQMQSATAYGTALAALDEEVVEPPLDE